MKSELSKRAEVTFPEFRFERHYMIPFTQAKGLPKELAHWQSTVDQMLIGASFDGDAYLMIDQKHLQAGQAHRRTGLHVDNYWNPTMYAHGGGGHTSGGGHTRPGVHRPGGHRSYRNQAETIFLASSHLGAVAYTGEWQGSDDPHGDCKNIRTDGLIRTPLTAGLTWAGDAGAMLHESVPSEECYRTIVRINAPIALECLK